MTDDDTAWQPHCVVCAARGRTRRLPAGHVCATCHDRIADQLRRIPALAALAATHIPPATTGGDSGRAVPGSRPPLDVDALDATLGLPLVLAIPGDPSSAEPILTLLWSWERAIREDRRLTPPALLPEPVTLVHVCGFLLAHLDWATTEPDFDVAGLAEHVAACARVLARHDPDRPARILRVPCPAPQDARRTAVDRPLSAEQGQGWHVSTPQAPNASTGGTATGRSEDRPGTREPA